MVLQVLGIPPRKAPAGADPNRRSLYAAQQRGHGVPRTRRRRESTNRRRGFVYGLELALFPIGEELAFSLARKGSVFWLLIFAFLLGFGTTVAEPALTAVAKEASEVAARAGAIANSNEARAGYVLGLRITVALSVGTALIVGVLRILFGWSLPKMIIAGYALVIGMTAIAPAEVVGIAYDSGGVTTSTVTVPLVAALGIGIASSLRNRNPMTDGFGLIAFASLTPMIFVMAYGGLIAWI